MSNEESAASFVSGRRIERTMTVRRAELDQILNTNYRPENLVNLLEKDFGAEYAADAGVWERYTIREHTLMVLSQFEKYFSINPLPHGVDKNLFRVILALHDIGKPEALHRGRKHEQHTYTTRILNSAFDQLGFDVQDKNLALSLVASDVLGDYVKFGYLSETAQKIADLAKTTNKTPSEFLDLQSILYQVDAGSYTQDAGGYASLDYLFEFDQKNHSMGYSPMINSKMEILRSSVNKLPQISNKVEN